MSSLEQEYKHIVSYLSKEGVGNPSEVCGEHDGSVPCYQDAMEVLLYSEVVQETETGDYRLTDEKPAKLGQRSWNTIFQENSWEEIRDTIDPVGQALNPEQDPETVEYHENSSEHRDETDTDDRKTDARVTQALEETGLNHLL